MNIATHNIYDSNNGMLTIQFISADSLINIYISFDRTDNFFYLEEKLF